MEGDFFLQGGILVQWVSRGPQRQSNLKHYPDSTLGMSIIISELGELRVLVFLTMKSKECVVVRELGEKIY